MYITVGSTRECLGPNDSKCLLLHFDNNEEFEVHGDTHVSSSSSSLLSSRPSVSSTPILSNSVFQPVSIPGNPTPRRPTFSSSKSRPVMKVHVVFAMFRGKENVDLLEKEQAYIPVGEAQANVTFVLEAVRAKWGHNLEIVTKNGLPLVDEPGTRGK